jgi:hypothetical protein
VDELEALRRENAAQRQQIAQLIEQLARLNERVAELLAVAQRKQRKARAPVVPPPPAPPPVVEGEERRAFEERPKAPEKPQTEPAAKKKAKPTGRKALPGHLEAEEHTLRPDACAVTDQRRRDVERAKA